MAEARSWRRALEFVRSIGAYPGEPETQRGGRRVLMVAVIVSSPLTIPTIFTNA